MIYTYNELIYLQLKLFHKYQALVLTQKNIEVLTNMSRGNWTYIVSQQKNRPLTLTKNVSTGFWEITNGRTQDGIYTNYFRLEKVCRSDTFVQYSCGNPGGPIEDVNNIKVTSYTTWEIRGIPQTTELTTNLNRNL